MKKGGDQMKEEYEQPKIDIIAINGDVITASGGCSTEGQEVCPIDIE